MSKPSGAREVVAVRLEPELLERIDKLADELNKQLPFMKMNRSVLVRLVLLSSMDKAEELARCETGVNLLAALTGQPRHGSRTSATTNWTFVWPAPAQRRGRAAAASPAGETAARSATPA